MSGIEDGSVEEGKRRHDNARNGPRKKQKAPDAFVLDTVGDASLLKSAGCGDSTHCSVAEVHGAQARKQNCGDVVNAKSWPTNKNVQLFTFECVELDASCFARKSLLAFAALAGLNPQRAGNLAASATLHAFHVLRQLYECITPGCARLQKRTVTVEDAKQALEGRAEFGVDLPPPPVGLAPDKQQQVEELRSRFAASPKRQLFLNSGSAAANAFRYTARKFFQEYDGGSVSAKTKTFSQKKGGFMLHDSLVVELQAVVAARLVWHFHGYVNDAVETGVGAQLVAQ